MLAKIIDLRQRSSEQGLTLMEVLVALIIIQIVIALIAPPLLLAAATRLQNQRVEQATQLAQGEIDRIRLLVERGQYVANELPPLSAQADIRSTAAPNAVINTGATTAATQGRRIDVDGDNTQDFVVQTFRGQQQLLPNGIPVAFRMGVRIYLAQAFASSPYTTQTNPVDIGFTSGVNIQRPLAVVYVPIVRNDREFSLCEYHRFLRLSLQNPPALPAQCTNP